MIEAMKQAIEALECALSDNKPYLTKCVHAITTLRQAIAEAEKQEPVGHLQEEFFGRGQVMWFKKPADQSMLYTHPPKRERVVFPTMLRKMWSGGEVQAWLYEHVNKEKST